MKKMVLLASLVLLPLKVQAGVCTLFGGYGCANGNYYGYNTHKAHQEGMIYQAKTGQNGYGISRGYPWYGSWEGYYPEYVTNPNKYHDAPLNIRPVFKNNNNFYAPPVLDYYIEVRPVPNKPTSYNEPMTIRDSRAQVGYNGMVRAGYMGNYKCSNGICAPQFTPEQLQAVASSKRVYSNPIEDGAVFESIYKIISERYLNPISVEELAELGLSSIHDGIGIRINEKENSVSLTRNGISIRTFKDKPYKDDIKGWANLTYQIIDTLAHQSLKFGVQTHSELLKKFFVGISAKLDSASKYIDAKEKVPNKINNRDLDALLYSVKNKHAADEYEKRQNISLKINQRKQAVLTIRSFEDNSLNEVKNLLSPQLDALYKGKLGGLIIDLRDNKGGIVGSAIDIADLFLDKGKVIAMTKGRHKDSERMYEAVSEDMLKGAKIVVLVNNNTASAAEILAAALQENQRAIIMGKRTYGKGTVQTSILLDDGSEISFSWAYVYTPEGNIIDKKGIIPDYIVTSSSYSILDRATKMFKNLTIPLKEEKKENVEVKEDSFVADADKEEVKVEVKENTEIKEEVKADDEVKEEPKVIEEVKEEIATPIVPVEKEVVEETKEPAQLEEVKEEPKAVDEVVSKGVMDFNSLIKSQSEAQETKEEIKEEPKSEPVEEVKTEEKQDAILNPGEQIPAINEKSLDWFLDNEKKLDENVKEGKDVPASPLDMIGNKPSETKDEVKKEEKTAEPVKKEEVKKEETLDDLPVLF